MRGNTASGVTWRSSLPFLWLFLLGTGLALLVGDASDAGLVQVAKDLLPVLAFFALWSLMEAQPRLVGVARWSFVGAALLVLASVQVDQSQRAGGILNENYAPHFLAIGVLFALQLRTWPVVKALLVVAFALGVLQTGSFGSILMLLGFLAYWVWSSGNRLPMGPRVLLQAGFVLLVLLAAPSLERQLSQEGLGVGSGFAADRYTRSSGDRWEMYRSGLESAQDNLFGLGPGQYRYVSESGAEAEMHNILMRFALENGVVGFVGIVGLVVTVVRRTQPGGAARTLMVGLVLAGLVRDSWNYRHAWVALAIAVAGDQLRQSHGVRTPQQVEPSLPASSRA